jgi:hypothetical protein
MNMTLEKAIKIFEKYNPASDVIRCPNGRANVRKQLDLYAQAAMNLYGVIRRDEIVDIFNEQNVDQTSADEIYILLLPLALKGGRYGFYKEYIAGYSFLDDFDQVDFLLKHQDGKPRYIPEKEEFLKYVDINYIDNHHLWDLRRFMCLVFEFSIDNTEAYMEILEYIIYGNRMNKLGPIMESRNLVFEDEDQANEFLKLITLAKNNTRMWENKGHTPYEINDILRERNKNIINFPIMQKPKTGRNDQCPCGSGKKYKKCCAIFDDEKTAQLSTEDCRLFYETWYGLLGFVNDQKNIVRAKIKPEYPNAVNDMQMHKVRDLLWESPELIDEHICKSELSQEKISILNLWKTNHKKVIMIILEYQKEYALGLFSDENSEDRIYGIKGISNSIAVTLQRKLPVTVETVLLPFKGMIVYDSFLSTMPLTYGEGAMAMFHEIYDKAIQHEIITSFE